MTSVYVAPLAEYDGTPIDACGLHPLLRRAAGNMLLHHRVALSHEVLRRAYIGTIPGIGIDNEVEVLLIPITASPEKMVGTLCGTDILGGTDGVAHHLTQISINSLAELYVPNEYLFDYQIDSNWSRFVLKPYGATETTVTDNDVAVVADDNTATFTWPTSNTADSYTIDITQDGILFCQLTFNANGQLTGIAFAPGRDGQSMAPAAVMTANGLQFTVTGLSSNTEYGYTITAKDAEDAEVASYSGSFTTTSEGVVTGLDNTPFLSGEVRGEASKLLRNGEVLILRDGKTYSIQGVEVK